MNKLSPLEALQQIVRDLADISQDIQGSINNKEIDEHIQLFDKIKEDFEIISCVYKRIKNSLDSNKNLLENEKIF